VGRHIDSDKVKSLCLTNEAPSHENVSWSGSIDPHILVLCANWRRVVSFMPRPFYPHKKCNWYHCIGGWPGPRANLDDVEKILGPTET
jgi:hypothetical protein